MKLLQKLLLGAGAAVLLACSSGAQQMNERTAFEKSFIGLVWTPSPTDHHQRPLSKECVYTGGYLLQMPDPRRLSIASFVCDDGRALELLGESLGDAGYQRPTWRIVDAILLPALKQGEEYMMTGECSLRDKTDVNFLTIVHLGDRDLVDWKTGVRAAWLPNIETKQFEPLSTRHIVCERPTPP